MHVVETEDEHAEARFVAAEIAGARRGRHEPREIAVVYRTNAQSRVLEDVLVRQGIAYQVIGGPRFYERAEIKDAIAYLQVIDNPYDAVSLPRIANRPRRGVGDTSLARLQTLADGDGHLALGGARPRRGGRASAPRRCRRCSGFRNAAPVADGDGDRRARSPDCSRRCSSAPATSRRSRPSGRSRRAGSIENLEELVGVAREYEAARDGAVAVELPAGDLALLRPGRAARRRRAAAR